MRLKVKIMVTLEAWARNTRKEHRETSGDVSNFQVLDLGTGYKG